MKKIGQLNPPPCRAACPAGINVPLYIRYLQAGKFPEALGVIRDKIPFPAVCGYACAHPCESRCARVQYDQSVAIRLLKRAAAEYGAEAPVAAECGGEEGVLPPPGPGTQKQVAIIGAGPCGLSAAYYLAGFGHQVSVFEALEEPGGMLRYGIPEYRLPKAILDREIDLVRARGAAIFTNTRITSPDELFNKGFAAILIAVGAWKGLGIDLAGADKVQTVDGISFLKEANSGISPDIGQRIIVVGGGNTAIDAARVAVRLGGEVTVVYRRTRAEMPAAPEEIREAVEEGVQIEFLTTPGYFAENGLVCRRMSLGPLDERGRPRSIPVEGSEFFLPCDTVIMAVGQSVDAAGFKLDKEAGGTVKIDPASFATGLQGIFAAGDAVTGPSSIIEAIAQGRLVSSSIDKFLGGTGEMDSRDSYGAIPDFGQIIPPGQARPDLLTRAGVERIKDFQPVEFGYDRATAMNESRRCLACDVREFAVAIDSRLCKGCGYCREMCSLGIFRPSDAFNPSGYKPAAAAETHKCVGCLKCLYGCPDFAISIQPADY